MKISQVGEFGLISRIKSRVKSDSSVVAGIGDDCAVLKYNRVFYALLTADMIIEGVDFRSQDDPFFIGRKAMAVSVSDIAACGGVPKYALVSLGIPKNNSLDVIDGLYRGMNSIARKYGICIVGGDLSGSRRLVINVSMSGIVEKKFLVLRSGAKTGDIIVVSGRLGGSLKGRHFTFIPRLKEARFLVENFKINAMIDISDGLMQDLGHILKASSKGAVIHGKLIPVSKSASGMREVLCAGEDFELLFTIPEKDARVLLKKKPRMYQAIGRITSKAGELVFIDKKGRSKVPCVAGFRHF